MKLPPSGKIVYDSDMEFDEVQEIPEVVFSDSKLFYIGSPDYINNRRIIKFAAGFKCSQCDLKSRHNAQSGYCYMHKRIVDMGETCPYNTRNEYKNVNF